MSTGNNGNANGQVVQYPNHDFLTAERIHSMAELNKDMPYSDELLAARLLRENKIFAIPGRFSGWHYTDLVAFGIVRIETKISAVVTSKDKLVFQWRLKSRKTHEMGLRGEIVMLLADYGDKVDVALFPVTHPIFYRHDGTLKHGFAYRPNKQSTGSEDRYGVTLNDEIWNEHRDNYDLVWETFYKNVTRL